MVPEWLYGNDKENAKKLWEKLSGGDKFYLKMLDLEAAHIHKLDNYQNFAKAFKVDNYTLLMGNQKANTAQLKSATKFKRSDVNSFEFDTSIICLILYALYELQTELESELVLHHFWENCRGKYKS